jgi:prephenate dehydrogenase
MGGLGQVAPDAARAVDSVGIVGVGLIGGSIALAARRARPELRLIGVDRGTALQRASALGAFDAVASDLEALRGVSLIVLCAPVRQNVAVLGELARLLGGCGVGNSGSGVAAVITDTGSTKRAMLQAARTLPDTLSFVGGHQVAGAARAGAAAARADLFRGRPWVLTPGEPTRALAHVELVASFVAALGAEPRVIDADTHDRVIAFLSHLPQLTASALMHVVGLAVGPEHLSLAGGGLTDTTRLAASPPEIWRDICATNDDAIGPAIDALIETLQRLRADLPHGTAIADVFESAARWRAAIDTTSETAAGAGHLP